MTFQSFWKSIILGVIAITLLCGLNSSVLATTIEGTIFLDMNNNGVMDPCEQTRSDRIFIKPQSSNATTVVFTNDGKYSFTSSDTGLFMLSIDVPYGQKLTAPVSGEGFVTYNLRISDANESVTVNFGFFEDMEVPNTTPTVTLGDIPTTVEVNTQVKFTAQISGDMLCNGNGSPKWDFGDGISADGSDVTHTYTIPGTYTAIIKAFGLFAGIGEAQVAITVKQPPQPKMKVSTTSVDFGGNIVSRKKYQRITISNIGDAPLQIGTISLKGEDSADFGARFYSCSSRTISPSSSCRMYTYFQPRSVGQKDTTLVIPSNEPVRARDDREERISLSGTGDPTPDGSKSEKACNLELTIKSSGNGEWEKFATWMVKGTSGDWVASDRIPDEDDVVSIQTGHQVTGSSSEVTVKALCNKGCLIGKQHGNAIPYALEIRATDSISNHGDIIGKNGPSGKNGGDVILTVAGQKAKSYSKRGDWWWYSHQSGGPIYNNGNIIGGAGGSCYNDACGKGGNAIVLGRNTANAEEGVIKAGNGGKNGYTGTGGEGGLTQVWGKLGGRGYLVNKGDIKGGDGGGSTLGKGGKGGNLWLVSLPDVYLDGGRNSTHNSPGKGGGGSGNGNNGNKGRLTIEPNSISITNTTIEASDVSIYGSNDWTLDLNNMNGTIDATDNITLAVGDGGVVDLTGNTGTVLKAGNKVNIFSDAVMLDEGVELKDIIDAEEIVTGPAKILRDVSLTGVSNVIGEPGDTVSVRVMLANNSPEKDTFTLTATDSAGSSLNQLPPSIELEGLEMAEFVVNVTLPATEGSKDAITVTAVSQSDPNAVSTMEMKVFGESEPEDKVDVWVADPAPDAGVEPNTVSRSIWRSPAVWVRNQQDDVYQYQNVKYGQDNFVYVRVKNIGNLTATDTTVEVYRVDSSLGSGWPNGWRQVGTANIDSLDPNASEDVVIRWDESEIPKPGHYCFYIRLLNDDDPMTFTEGNRPVRNTYNNNNIAWRNFNVVGLLNRSSSASGWKRMKCRQSP